MAINPDSIRSFLELQYGTDSGVAWIGAKAGNSFSDKGFAWPQEKDQLVEYVVGVNSGGGNVWFAAHLSYSKTSRAKGQSVKRRRLHVDIDRALTDQDREKIAQLDAWVVYSGSPGHVHAYVELNRSVDVGTYHRLEDMLVAWFDSDQAVCRDNGLLRIPGTINQMGGKKTHEPAEVTWNVPEQGLPRTWEPEALLALIPGEVVERVEKKLEVDYGADAIAIEGIPQLPQSVLDVITQPNDDRSDRVLRIINAARAAGLTIGQTKAILQAVPELVQRWQEKNRSESWINGEIRKLYFSADDHNPQLIERKNDEVLVMLPSGDYDDYDDRMRDQSDNEILLGVEAATEALERFRQFETESAVTGIAEQIEDAIQGKTWGAMDYEDVLDGSYVPTMPTMFTLTSGTSLIYPGEIHSFFGEPGSAKSLIAQIECIKQVKLGNDILYVDFEDDKGGVISRLLDFGGKDDEFKNLLRQHFVYVRPREAFVQGAPKWEELLTRPFTLCVLDGVTESMGLTNHELNDNSDIAKWIRIMPGDIRDKTGAAVIMIDHVTKSRDGNSRMALGGGHKLAAITGAAYVIEQDARSSVGRDAKGVVVMRLSKDRPGYISGRLGAKKNGLQEAARIIIDSTGESPVATFGPHEKELTEGQVQFSLRRLIFDTVAHNPGWNKTAIKAVLKEGGTKFKDQEANSVIDLLVAQNHLRIQALGRAQQLFVGEVPLPQERMPSADDFLND